MESAIKKTCGAHWIENSKPSIIHAGSLSTFFSKLGAYFSKVPTSEMAGEAKPRLKCAERAQPVSRTVVRALASDGFGSIYLDTGWGQA
jgi:hypothetical protein